MSNTFTSKSLIPFEQTVGYLIDYIHDGIESGNATAIAIKAQFGAYCECSIAQWINDGINNVGADPTVMNKLRLLLATDPYAIIDKVTRQSPPEKLMRRFCNAGNLVGSYLNLTGSEVTQILSAPSALCPPVVVEPEVEYYILDTLSNTPSTSPTVLSDRTLTATDWPVTVRVEFPKSGPNAFWGTSTATLVKVTITNTSNTWDFTMAVKFHQQTAGYVALAPNQTVVWTGEYVLPPNKDFVRVYLTPFYVDRHPGGTLGGEGFVFFDDVTVPINTTTFLNHLPEIGTNYITRPDSDKLLLSDALRAEPDFDETGMTFINTVTTAISGDMPSEPAVFTSDGLKLSTVSTDFYVETVDPFSFISKLSGEYSYEPGSGNFPPTHLNLTNIPQTNIETGITIRVPAKVAGYYGDSEITEGNWPQQIFIVLAFDTDPDISNGSRYPIGKSYEDGYGSALVLCIGQGSYGPEVFSRIIGRKNVSDFETTILRTTDNENLVEIFDSRFASYFTTQEKEAYFEGGDQSMLLKRLYKKAGDQDKFELNVSVRTYHGQICLLFNGMPVLNFENYGVPYNNDTTQQLRCGFYVGSFTYPSWNYDAAPEKAHILATDYYVKPFELEGWTDLQLIWDAAYFPGTTTVQRTANKSILLGDTWNNQLAFDTTIPQYPGFMNNGNILFTIEAPALDYKHLSFAANDYEELPGGQIELLKTTQLAFDPDSHIGTLSFDVAYGFTPEFWRSGNESAWDNDTWWKELVISYKGFVFGKITIMFYAPTSQTNGPYLYGTGFMVMSKLQYV